MGIRSGNGTGAEDTLVGQYEAYLEKRVADALECVEGVGKTEVVITLKSSGQKVIEKDQISNSRTTTEEDSAGGTRGEKEGETEKTSIYEQREDALCEPGDAAGGGGRCCDRGGGRSSGRRAKYHGSDPGIIWDRSA